MIIPVEGRIAPGPVQVIEGPGVGKGREHGEFSKVQVDLHEKIDKPADGVFRVVVHTQEDRSLHGDAEVVTG